MSVVKELIRTEENGTISFGNYELSVKSKVSDYEHRGDMYKVKTFSEITKLERNGMFVYESVPGTTVFDLTQENIKIIEKEAANNCSLFCSGRKRWLKQEKPYIFARIVAMNQRNGWDSVQAAMNGILLWRRQFHRCRRERMERGVKAWRSPRDLVR